MQEMHCNHPSIVKMKALSRGYLWWPGQATDLEYCVQKCKACQAVRNAPVLASLHPPGKVFMWILPVQWRGRCSCWWLIDTHLYWPEIIEINSTTSKQTITELRQLIAAHGLPTQFVSDNGPQFTSEVATFCKNGVKHVRCSSYHPVLNGWLKG